jgi:hypothetical protein
MLMVFFQLLLSSDKMVAQTSKKTLEFDAGGAFWVLSKRPKLQERELL